MVSHPLDPLSAAEMSAAAEACRQYAAAQGVASLRFNTITLKVGGGVCVVGMGGGREE